MRWRRALREVRNAMARQWPCDHRLRAAFPDASVPEHWRCQLTAPHRGLHQIEIRGIRGKRMLWVWSSDGAYHGFHLHRHDYDDRA